MPCFRDEETINKGNWIVATEAYALHFVDWSGTKRYEFEKEEQAMQRMWEMVFAGWDMDSTAVWFEAEME